MTVGGRGRGLGKGVPHQEMRVRKGREGARVVPGLVTQVTRIWHEAPLCCPGGAGGVLGAGAARQQCSLGEGTREEGPSKPGGERRGDPPPPFIAHRLVPSRSAAAAAAVAAGRRSSPEVGSG